MANNRPLAGAFWWTLVGILMTAFFLVPVFSGEWQAIISALIAAHPSWAFAIVAFARFLAIVVAPLPGQSVAFASLAVMPWHEAWLANLAGADLGAFVAFFIARKFREPIAARFTGLHDLHAWEAAIGIRQKFWGFLGLRAVAASALDFFSYAAGLTKVPFSVFVLATVIVDIPITLAFFYFGGMAMRFGAYIALAFMLIFGIAGGIIGARFIPRNSFSK